MRVVDDEKGGEGVNERDVTGWRTFRRGMSMKGRYPILTLTMSWNDFRQGKRGDV